MNESPVIKQLELVHKLIASHDHRVRFLSDSDVYLQSEKIVLSPDLKNSLTDSLKTLESEFEKLGRANPFLITTLPTEEKSTTMNVAAAAVVSAAAAVVSAAAAVTSATSAAKMAK